MCVVLGASVASISTRLVADAHQDPDQGPDQDPAALEDEGPILTTHIRCVRCKYDLSGAPALGNCPECGLEVVVTLAQNSDPAVADLIRPQRPGLAAAGVMALALAPFVAVCIQGISPVLHFIDRLTGRGAAFPSQIERPMWLIAGLVLLAAAMLATRALSRRANPTLRTTASKYLPRSVATLWVWGLVLEAGFAVSFLPGMELRSYGAIVLAAQLLPAVLYLTWAGVAIGRIGAHSRAYREARHGRQSGELVTITLAGAMTLSMIHPALEPLGYPEIADISGILALVLTALSVLGLAYLVANAWVIGTALRRPRIDVERLV